MPNETWKPVVGYESLYAVSSLGRVKRTAPGKGTWPGRMLRPGRDSGGYPLVVLCNKPQLPLSVRVHDLVLTAFRGPRPSGMEARHLNGYSSDNLLSNLEWGTPQENGQDRVRHGTGCYGERVHNAKLDRQAAREIFLWAHDAECSHESIAAAYGVEHSRVSYIKTRRNWSQATADLVEVVH